MQRTPFLRRRICAFGTTIALTGLLTGVGMLQVTSASAATTGAAAPAGSASGTGTTGTAAGTGSSSTGTASTGSSSSAGTTSTGSTGAASTGSGTTSTGTTAASGSTSTGSTGTSSTGSTGTSSTGSGSTSTGSTSTSTATPAPTSTPTATSSPAAAPTAPATTSSQARVTPLAAPAAAGPTVTLPATANAGDTITASTAGFTGTAFTYVWSVENVVDPTVTGNSFLVDTTDVGKTISVTVTSNVPGETATASVVVPQPEFVDANGKAVITTPDNPLELTTTAGDNWSYQFRAAGTPTPTLKAVFSDPADADPSESPSDYFPDDTVFDPTTGIISGTPTAAGIYDFAVQATSGTATTTEYVEVTVTPAAAFGVEVYTADKGAVDSNSLPATAWIIDTDGQVYTLHVSADGDSELIPGGQPTVKQGGTLLVGGTVVDRYGNAVDDGSGNTPSFKVTSNVATDVIGYSDTYSANTVTFPHASTHRISVTGDGFSNAFNVVVTPVIATVAATTPTTGSGAVTTSELAYTGSESSELVPWALGLVLAGAGIGAVQRMRRRRAER